MNLVITRIFCQSLDPLLYQGCTVLKRTVVIFFGSLSQPKFTYTYKQLRPCGLRLCYQDHLPHMEICGSAHISNTSP